MTHARLGADGARERRQVVAGHARDHARRGEGGSHVDTRDARVGQGAAHEGDVERAGRGEVGDVAPASRDEPRVLDARQGRADQLRPRATSVRRRQARPRRRGAAAFTASMMP